MQNNNISKFIMVFIIGISISNYVKAAAPLAWVAGQLVTGVAAGAATEHIFAGDRVTSAQLAPIASNQLQLFNGQQELLGQQRLLMAQMAQMDALNNSTHPTPLPPMPVQVGLTAAGVISAQAGAQCILKDKTSEGVALYGASAAAFIAASGRPELGGAIAATSLVGYAGYKGVRKIAQDQDCISQ